MERSTPGRAPLPGRSPRGRISSPTGGTIRRRARQPLARTSSPINATAESDFQLAKAGSCPPRIRTPCRRWPSCRPLNGEITEIAMSMPKVMKPALVPPARLCAAVVLPLVLGGCQHTHSPEDLNGTWKGTGHTINSSGRSHTNKYLVLEVDAHGLVERTPGWRLREGPGGHSGDTKLNQSVRNGSSAPSSPRPAKFIWWKPRRTTTSTGRCSTRSAFGWCSSSRARSRQPRATSS